MPNGKAAKVVGASSGKSLKILSPEQLNPPPEGVFPQRAITQGAAPAVPEPTSGILVMVTQEQNQNLHSPAPQIKSYKQPSIIPQATQAPLPVLLQGKGPKPAAQPTPEFAHMGPQGKGPKAGRPVAVIQSNPAPEPAVILPEGKYPTGKTCHCSSF